MNGIDHRIDRVKELLSCQTLQLFNVFNDYGGIFKSVDVELEESLEREYCYNIFITVKTTNSKTFKINDFIYDGDKDVILVNSAEELVKLDEEMLFVYVSAAFLEI